MYIYICIYICIYIYKYLYIYIWFRVSCSRPPPYGMGVTSPPSHPPRHPPRHPPPTPAHHIHRGEGIHRHMHRHVHIIHTVYICTYTCYIRIHKHIYIYIYVLVCIYVYTHIWWTTSATTSVACFVGPWLPSSPTGACALFCRSAFAALCQSQLRGTERIIPKAYGLIREIWNWVGMRTYSQMQIGLCMLMLVLILGYLVYNIL